MWKPLTPLLTGLSLLLTIPALASARPGQALLVKTLKAAETDKATVTVEIRGQLRDDPSEILRPFGVHWYLNAGGQQYYLELGGARELEALAAKLSGRTLVATGRLEVHRSWMIVRVSSLTAVAETIEERVYEGGSANSWQTENTIFALKSGDRRPMVEHIRALLGEDLKAGQHTVRVEGSRLIVRTSARNHERIREFLELAARIPGPVR